MSTMRTANNHLRRCVRCVRHGFILLPYTCVPSALRCPKKHVYHKASPTAFATSGIRVAFRYLVFRHRSAIFRAAPFKLFHRCEITVGY